MKTYILGKLLLSNTGPGWKTVTFIFQENHVLLVWKWLWMVSTDKVVLEFSSFIRKQPWGKILPKDTEIMWEWKCLKTIYTLSEDKSENVDSELNLAYWLANWPLVNYRLMLVYNRTPKFQFRNCLLSCSMVCSACFPEQPWGWDHPLLWDLTHQSLIKKMPHRHGHSPGYRGNFKSNFKSDGGSFPISWDSLFPNMSQFV